MLSRWHPQVTQGQAGIKPSASYYLAESRALRKGAGAGCQPSSDPGALFSLALVSPSSYSPLESALAPAFASFSGGLTDGWTLELWLKSAPIQAGDTADRVLAVLIASDTRSSSTTASLQTDWCGKGPPYGDQVSFMLIMKSSGCLYVRLKMTDNECATLPSRNQCESSDRNNSPLSPGVDMLDSSKLQHVVVSFSSFLGDGDVDPEVPRFAIYVDTELKSSDANSGGSLGLPAGLRGSNGQNFVPSALWPAGHVLRVGFDATGDLNSQWEGELFMLAMYGKPLTAAEVAANFAASLDNNAPVASDGSHNLMEDACSKLPAFAYSDWDNTPDRAALGASAAMQTHTFRVDPSTLTGGMLFTDSSCTTQLAATATDVSDGQLWFKPTADEYQPAFTYSGASYASFQWSVTDDGTPPGTDTAIMTLNVAAVNDAPVAGDNALEAFMEIRKRIYVGGSDVDGDDPEQPCSDPADSTPTTAPASVGCGKIRNARLRILQLPQRGKLLAVESGGSLGMQLVAGAVMGEGGWGQLNIDPDNANPSVYYVSDTIYTSASECTLSKGH